MRLLLVRLGREDEVARDYGKFVEHEEVRRCAGGDVGDVQRGRGVVEGVKVFLGSRGGALEFRDRFLG